MSAGRGFGHDVAQDRNARLVGRIGAGPWAVREHWPGRLTSLGPRDELETVWLGSRHPMSRSFGVLTPRWLRVTCVNWNSASPATRSGTSQVATSTPESGWAGQRSEMSFFYSWVRCRGARCAQNSWTSP